MCNGFVRFLLRHDRRQVISFTSSNTKLGADMFRYHGQVPERPVSVILNEGRQNWLESSAIIRSVAALGGPWRAASVLLLVPPVLRDPAYRFIARNRYRWFGKLDHCPTPDPAHASRFVQ